MNRREALCGAAALLVSARWTQAVWAARGEALRAEKPHADETFSFFFPTPQATVVRMLELARVGPADLVLDLGSGDGRIPISAARYFGARGWGVDSDAELIGQSIAEAKRQGVAERVRFEQRDVLKTDTSKATVVTIYLLPGLIARLRRKLLAELKPGARILVHDFTMTDWSPDETLTFYVPERNQGRGGESTVRLWVVPANFSGDWDARIEGARSESLALSIRQRFQRAGGLARRGAEAWDLTSVAVRGAQIAFGIEAGETQYEVSARLEGDAMMGEVHIRRGTDAPATARWSARRTSRRQPLDGTER
ncbi:MAG: class I SAM-dependent methyltransferase [Betaproteobacteria bacterium]|nr:class I SAM-dependent methyltransferase [Betaproteobacteria bacterium]